MSDIFPKDFEPKSPDAEDMKSSGKPSPKELLEMLKGIADVTGPALRAKALEMALQLESVKYAEDAISAAETLIAYLKDGKK